MAEKQKSKAFHWLIGCTIAIVLVGALCIGGSWLAFNYFIDSAVELAHASFVEMIDDSQLPEEQVLSIKSDLDRLKDAALDRSIELENLQGLDREFERVASLGFVQWYKVEVLSSVGFEEEERLGAQRTLERLARAIDDETMDLQDVNLQVRANTNDSSTTYDPDMVRLDVARVLEKVDAAGIPDEPYQVDVAADFSTLVDEILGVQ